MNLYHMSLRGVGLRDNTLYPLNELKIKHPDLHELHEAKYRDRPHVSEQHVPHLDCFWGDIVFLSPVSPEKICAALAQYHCRSVPTFQYQAIPVIDLDWDNLAIWLFRNRSFDPTEVLPFDYALLEQLQDVPAATIAYFAEQRDAQQPALFFAHVPHVLYKGRIDVRPYPVCYTTPYEPTT